mmetsp:Transcript_59146/g.129552  ORF Transcript_59146/g.129552 Transcript_59146/m.129552 type:complete len:181 (+) Transcript_59146:33-575(+)
MAGLRCINNVYTADGSGRDSIIVRNSEFMQGKRMLREWTAPEPKHAVLKQRSSPGAPRLPTKLRVEQLHLGLRCSTNVYGKKHFGEIPLSLSASASAPSLHGTGHGDGKMARTHSGKTTPWATSRAASVAQWSSVTGLTSNAAKELTTRAQQAEERVQELERELAKLKSWASYGLAELRP